MLCDHDTIHVGHRSGVGGRVTGSLAASLRQQDGEMTVLAANPLQHVFSPFLSLSLSLSPSLLTRIAYRLQNKRWPDDRGRGPDRLAPIVWYARRVRYAQCLILADR